MMNRVRCDDTGEKKVFFAAANSRDGFVSFYGSIFGSENIKKRYLIKGGPGTGKSTFIRRVAGRAEAEGYSVEYYRCSSDPDSLDGALIDGKVALLDATAPHEANAELPGARDEIIDLGAFWSSDDLEALTKDIKALSDSKKRCYGIAYRFLDASGRVGEACMALISPFVKWKKMRRAAHKTVGVMPMGCGYSISIGLRDSVGMKGRVRLPVYENEAEKLYLVKDRFDVASLYLGMLAEEAVARHLKIRVSYSPVDTERIDGVMFDDSKTAFVVSDGCSSVDANSCVKVLDMSRFVDLSGAEGRSARREYRTARALSEGLIESAVCSLEDAGRYHLELERLYGKYMDFKGLSDYCEAFIQRLIEWLENHSSAKSH